MIHLAVICVENTNLEEDIEYLLPVSVIGTEVQKEIQKYFSK